MQSWPESRLTSTIHDYYFELLKIVATRSTCARRAVGCIVTDVNHHILSTGYNGVPRGMAHCIETPCEGRHDAPGKSDRCLAVHAEANALLQCWRLDLAHAMYCSVSPCLACAKLIANTPINVVFFIEEYVDTAGLDLLNEVGVTLRRAKAE